MIIPIADFHASRFVAPDETTGNIQIDKYYDVGETFIVGKKK